jgi:hypothetical protein
MNVMQDAPLGRYPAGHPAERCTIGFQRPHAPRRLPEDDIDEVEVDEQSHPAWPSQAGSFWSKTMNKNYKGVTGTREWAESNVNIQSGCENDCRYCYAKSMAMRYHGRASHTWQQPRPQKQNRVKNWRKHKGILMFPSSHDITPGNLHDCLEVLLKLLKAGNKVLIVSKPLPACIQVLCERLEQYKGQILFRFTIGSVDQKVLGYWEPHAPSYEERLASLQLAYAKGFQTSVSCEPMLDGNIDAVVSAVRPYVTHSIWLGKVNNLVQIVTMTCPGDDDVIDRARKLISTWDDTAVMALYERYKDDPLIRWKDSIKKAVGAVWWSKEPENW